MKIALLNLPIDDNFGGNLQRYALVKVLENLGHDVTHLLVARTRKVSYIKYPIIVLKRVMKRIFLNRLILNFLHLFYYFPLYNPFLIYLIFLIVH